VSVIAYRTWNAAPFAGILTPANGSMYADRRNLLQWERTWETPAVTAVCHVEGLPPHRAPAPGCTCGIYAWKRPIDPGWINQWNKGGRDNVVVGVVRLWGRMCDGPGMTGYRAQRARIVALVPNDNRNVDLAAQYPDVQIYPDLFTMYSEWDTTPELGFAMNADVADTRRRVARRVGWYGFCLGCGDRITGRQQTVDYDGLNPWADGEERPARFHRRAACLINLSKPAKPAKGQIVVHPQLPAAANSAQTFDRAWAYANRKPRKLYCPGVRTDHQDDTFTCSLGEDGCTAAGWRNGDLIQHASVKQCHDEGWPCHVCEFVCGGLIRFDDKDPA